MLGPESPSPRRLKSWAGARGTTHPAPVAEAEHREFLPGQPFLDDHRAAGRTERAAFEQCLDGCVGLGDRAADEDALAERQPIRLDRHLTAAFGGEGARRLGVAEGAVGGRRDAGFQHQLFGERLAALDPTGRAVRPEHRHSPSTQHIAHAGVDGRLRTQHSEINFFRPCQLQQRSRVIGLHRDVARESGGAGVAGRHQELAAERRLAALPGQRVLSRPSSNDEEPHGPSAVARQAPGVSVETGRGCALPSRYSHSMVPGGLLVMSKTTRLTPGTSLTIRFEIRASTSCGSRAQSAVMASSDVTTRTATTLAYVR